MELNKGQKKQWKSCTSQIVGVGYLRVLEKPNRHGDILWQLKMYFMYQKTLEVNIWYIQSQIRHKCNICVTVEIDCLGTGTEC